ncbi:phosphomevalonate kinase, peroxisomal [Nymphaea colorata]|nr:phosphomevalonate kinase, peroxisomal [Nymphaea colorata]XP_031502039.1 phosphomevalonate kinase, peroxisomal [Nymphaea colorata]
MAIVASAPGKVLIAGGYLLLERPNPGLVLTTGSRFYAIIKPLYEEIKDETWAWVWIDVKVTSPQLSREAMYKLSLKNLALQIDSPREKSNPFVEYALQYAVAAAKATFSDEPGKETLRRLLLKGLDVTILGCNDFYSYRNQIVAHGLPLTPETLVSLPPFSPITFNLGLANGKAAEDNTCKPEVAKTGLGSSAAMTTAVVASVLHYLGVVKLSVSCKDLEAEKLSADLDVIHAVAQTAHCIAQGKVGSGFDVSAAVYGSQHYVRFSPEILAVAQEDVKGMTLQEKMACILKSKWDHENAHFSLPPLMTLILGEPGTGGSSTPSMVGAVNKWKRSNPQSSLELWKRLAEANSRLEAQLKILSKFAEEQWEAYNMVLSSCSTCASDKWMEQAANSFQEGITKGLLGSRSTMLEIRSLMQEMGKAACVPIEPESQTRLLDATMEMEGVLLAGVPGAGGFDAVFAITLRESARSNVSQAWTSLGVLPMLVREDAQGVRLESVDPREKEKDLSSAISSVRLE